MNQNCDHNLYIIYWIVLSIVFVPALIHWDQLECNTLGQHQENELLWIEIKHIFVPMAIRKTQLLNMLWKTIIFSMSCHDSN